MALSFYNMKISFRLVSVDIISNHIYVFRPLFRLRSAPMRWRELGQVQPFPLLLNDASCLRLRGDRRASGIGRKRWNHFIAKAFQREVVNEKKF